MQNKLDFWMRLNTVTCIITEGQFEKLSGIAEMSMFFFRI